MFGFHWSPRQVHDDNAWRNDRHVKRLLRRRPVETPQRHFKFAVGDHVRLLERQSIFDKAYRGNYTQEVFHVEECKWAPWRNWVALYRVEDLVGEDVCGWFYKPKLARVPRPDKRVKTTVSRKKKSRVVTFEDYPATYTKEVSLPPKRKRKKTTTMTKSGGGRPEQRHLRVRPRRVSRVPLFARSSCRMRLREPESTHRVGGLLAVCP